MFCLILFINNFSLFFIALSLLCLNKWLLSSFSLSFIRPQIVIFLMLSSIKLLWSCCLTISNFASLFIYLAIIIFLLIISLPSPPFFFIWKFGCNLNFYTRICSKHKIYSLIFKHLFIIFRKDSEQRAIYIVLINQNIITWLKNRRNWHLCWYIALYFPFCQSLHSELCRSCMVLSL